MNPYTVLGIAPTATPEEIKAAYRGKAKANHPDTGGDAAIFAEINQANEILSDPERRRRFDEAGDVEDPDINDPDAMAWAIIAQGFELTLQAPQDWTDQDMIAGMKNGIDRVISELNQKIRLIEQEITRAEKMQKRFKRKVTTVGTDVLQGMLAFRAKRAGEMLEKIRAQRRDNERAKEILDGYDYEHLFTNQARVMQGGYHQFGSTSASGY